MSDLYGEMRFILGPEQQENLSGKWLADEIYGESENYEYKSTEFTNETGTLCKLNRKLRNDKLDMYIQAVLRK